MKVRKQVLTEKFSESMPQWLRDYLYAESAADMLDATQHDDSDKLKYATKVKNKLRKYAQNWQKTHPDLPYPLKSDTYTGKDLRGLLKGRTSKSSLGRADVQGTSSGGSTPYEDVGTTRHPDFQSLRQGLLNWEAPLQWLRIFESEDPQAYERVPIEKGVGIDLARAKFEVIKPKTDDAEGIGNGRKYFDDERLDHIIYLAQFNNQLSKIKEGTLPKTAEKERDKFKDNYYLPIYYIVDQNDVPHIYIPGVNDFEKDANIGQTNSNGVLRNNSWYTTSKQTLIGLNGKPTPNEKTHKNWFETDEEGNIVREPVDVTADTYKNRKGQPLYRDTSAQRLPMGKPKLKDDAGRWFFCEEVALINLKDWNNYRFPFVDSFKKTDKEGNSKTKYPNTPAYSRDVLTTTQHGKEYFSRIEAELLNNKQRLEKLANFVPSKYLDYYERLCSDYKKLNLWLQKAKKDLQEYDKSDKWQGLKERNLTRQMADKIKQDAYDEVKQVRMGEQLTLLFPDALSEDDLSPDDLQKLERATVAATDAWIKKNPKAYQELQNNALFNRPEIRVGIEGDSLEDRWNEISNGAELYKDSTNSNKQLPMTLDKLKGLIDTFNEAVDNLETNTFNELEQTSEYDI